MPLNTTNEIEVASYEALMQILPKLDPHNPTLVVNVARGGYEAFRDHIRATKALVSDFDGTLIAGSQWRDVGALMRADLAKADLEDAMEYFKEGGERSDLDDIMFIFRSIRRMIESGIAEGALHLAARAQMPRAGARELFNSFDRAAIISYGMRDYISRWRSVHGVGHIGACDIFALKLTWDRRMLGNCPLDGYEKSTVISDGNKGYAMDTFLAAHSLNPRDALVIGDAPTDIKMMHAQSCGVLIVPKFDAEPARMAHRMEGLRAMWPLVSAVLVSDTLMPLYELRTT